MSKYVLIRTDMSIELVDPADYGIPDYMPEPEDYRPFLDMCYKLIGCDSIEHVYDCSYIYVVDECGALKEDRVPNELLGFVLNYPYVVYGNAIACIQSGPDVFPLPDDEAVKVKETFEMLREFLR